MLSFNVNKHWLKSLHFPYVLHKLLKLHVWQKGGHVKSRTVMKNSWRDILSLVSLKGSVVWAEEMTDWMWGRSGLG